MSEPTTPEITPQEEMSQEALDSLLNDLKGFGITDNEQIVTLTVDNRRLQIRLSNLSNDDEIFGMLRAEGLKGYPWIHRLRCELLAKAITWMNGVKIHDGLYAKDPYGDGDRPVRLILVDLLLRWGQEAVLVLWKIYMVHCQQLEDNLHEQLPDSAVMTEVERRYMARIEEELIAHGALAIQETAEVAAAGSPDEGEGPEPE